MNSPTKEPATLRALRIPESLDNEVTKQMAERDENRTETILRLLRAATDPNSRPEVDWADFDREVHKALRISPSPARALKVARKALGL